MKIMSGNVDLYITWCFTHFKFGKVEGIFWFVGQNICVITFQIHIICILIMI